MKNLKGALMFAQSGGPTSVINASAAGVFIEGLKSPSITAVYGAAHGIRGVLNEEFYDIGQEDIKELKKRVIKLIDFAAVEDYKKEKQAKIEQEEELAKQKKAEEDRIAKENSTEYILKEIRDLLKAKSE